MSDEFDFLDDDIADILGTNDHPQPEDSKKSGMQNGQDDQSDSKTSALKGQDFKNRIRAIREEKEKKKASLSASSTRSRLLNSDSNSSLNVPSRKMSKNSSQSTVGTEASGMSKEDALSLLMEEEAVASRQLSAVPSSKTLSRNTSKSSNTQHSSDESSSPSVSKPKPQRKDKPKPSEIDFDLGLSDHEHDEESSSSDDDDIFSLLDQPRRNLPRSRSKTDTKSQPSESNPPTESSRPKPTVATIKPRPPTKLLDPEPISKPITESYDDLLQKWMKWLSLDKQNESHKAFVPLAEKAARTALPPGWVFKNNLYVNASSNQRSMNHPLLPQFRKELAEFRKQQQDAAARTPRPHTATSDTDRIQPAPRPVPQTQPVLFARKSAIPPVSSVAVTESSEKMVATLRNEIESYRQSVTQLTTERNELVKQLQLANQQSERLLSEQRARLMQSHNAETSKLRSEIHELQNSNSKLAADHQRELLDTEGKLRRSHLEESDRRVTELQVAEERLRDELSHAQELHRQTIEQLKKQHAREMSSVQELHGKQLESLRNQNQDSNALASTLQKIQASAKDLTRFQQEARIKQHASEQQRSEQLHVREKIMNEKDEELSRERRAHRELMERFNQLVQETRHEKLRIHDLEEQLREREAHVLDDFGQNNRELAVQRELLTEERHKFETGKVQWNKKMELEKIEIERMRKNQEHKMVEHGDVMKIDRDRVEKENQMIQEDKEHLSKQKQQYHMEMKKFEEERSAFMALRDEVEAEKTDFQMRVQQITNLSKRVHDQSARVATMYAETKRIEETFDHNKHLLDNRQNELEHFRRDLTLEQERLNHERQELEKERLDFMQTKRRILQHVDLADVIKQKRSLSNASSPERHTQSVPNLLATARAQPLQEQPIKHNIQPVVAAPLPVKPTKPKQEYHNVISSLEAFVQSNHSFLSHAREDLRKIRSRRRIHSTSSVSSASVTSIASPQFTPILAAHVPSSSRHSYQTPSSRYNANRLNRDKNKSFLSLHSWASLPNLPDQTLVTPVTNRSYSPMSSLIPVDTLTPLTQSRGQGKRDAPPTAPLKPRNLQTSKILEEPVVLDLKYQSGQDVNAEEDAAE